MRERKVVTSICEIRLGCHWVLIGIFIGFRLSASKFMPILPKFLVGWDDPMEYECLFLVTMMSLT